MSQKKVDALAGRRAILFLHDGPWLYIAFHSPQGHSEPWILMGRKHHPAGIARWKMQFRSSSGLAAVMREYGGLHDWHRYDLPPPDDPESAS